MQGDVGHAQDRQGEGRQHHVVQHVGEAHFGCGDADGYRKAQGEPAELHAEHDEHHECQPERGGGGEHEAIGLHAAVERAAALGARRDAQHSSDDARQKPGARHEGKRVTGLLGNDLDDGGVVAKGHAHVALERRREPFAIALPEGQTHSPVFGELGALLGAHADVGRLAYVCLHGVNGRGADQGKRDKAHGKEQQDHLGCIA